MTDRYRLGACNKIYVPDQDFEYSSGDSVAIRTNHIQNFLSRVNIDKPIRLVTGFTDFPPELFLTYDEFLVILNSSYVLEWQAMNTMWSHPKLVHIGLGILSHAYTYFAEHSEMLQALPKKDEIFYSFQTESNPHERSDLPNSGGKMTMDTYARAMASHKYVYCPMGAGMDTYRFYEAVCCGCIPIVKAPKGFLETYTSFNYVCVPGTCYVVPGIIGHVWRKESPYVCEKQDKENSIKQVTFEASTLYHGEDEIKKIHQQWMHYNNNVLSHGFGGLRLVQPL